MTIYVSSVGRSTIYASHRMLATRHRSTILERNESNDTTTMVTPSRLAVAGNMNNTLLPTLVPMTITIRLRRCTIVRNAFSYTLQNSTSIRCVICCNIWRWLAYSTIYYRRTCWWRILSTILFRSILSTRLYSILVSRVDANLKNWYYSILTRRNLSRSYTVY